MTTIEKLTLNLGGYRWSAEALKEVSSLASLTEIYIIYYGKTFPEGTLRDWAGHVPLKRLRLLGFRLSSEDLADLAGFKHLRSLSLEAYTIPSEALPPQLTSLELRDPIRFDESFPDFSSATALDSVVIRIRSDRSFRTMSSAVGKTPNLASLEIRVDVGEEDGPPDAPWAKDADTSTYTVQVKHMKALSGLSKLSSLKLTIRLYMRRRISLENGAFVELVKLKSLRTLELSVPGFTGRQLVELQNHAGIEELMLGDGKFDSIHPFKAGFKGLKRLFVRGKAKLNLKALKKARKELQINPDQSE